MTPLKGTDPKLVSGGAPTRGKIGEGMGNMPNLGIVAYVLMRELSKQSIRLDACYGINGHGLLKKSTSKFVALTTASLYLTAMSKSSWRG